MQGKWSIAVAAVLLVPKANHAVFGPLTPADRSHVAAELRGTLLQAAIALIVFREPVGWRALYAILPSLALRYLHSMVGTRLDEKQSARRTQTGLLLLVLHVLDMVWAHYWAVKVMAEKGLSPLALAFVADIGVLWGQLVMYTGNFVFAGTRVERYIVHGYSYVLRLMVYLSLFWLMATQWYIPVHIAKDTWAMLRMLVRYCARWIRYKRAFKRYGMRPAIESGQCPICFEAGSGLEVELRCGHAMHFDCVYRWLEVSAVCPLCRANQRVQDTSQCAEHANANENENDSHNSHNSHNAHNAHDAQLPHAGHADHAPRAS